MLNTTIRFSRTVLRRYGSTSVPAPEKWDILSAVSVERKPILCRDLDEMENKFLTVLNQMEIEQSHKSDFEIRIEEDAKRAERLKKERASDLDIDGAPQQTAHDYLDTCTEELKSFQFASRVGSKKEEEDVKSTQRALDRHLLLLIQEKIGDAPRWVLPQGEWRPGETLRATAERVLKEKCGDNLKVQFYGNAPSGFYKYRYPKKASRPTVGAKIFFYKARLIDGTVKLDKSCSDFQWGTRNELHKLPDKYLKSVSLFLVDEEH